MIESDTAHEVEIPVGTLIVHGDLRVPRSSRGLVVFAHGSGSSRFSRRNQQVAEVLVREGFATLLLDLLTQSEEAADVSTAKYRFDIARLGQRVSAAVDWAEVHPQLRELPLGCFGASTGAAAALLAAAERPASVAAVVSRGGRPDLAGDALPRVEAPTLLIVGGRDEEVIEMNRTAMQEMRAPVRLEIVPGATHLFPEPGALDRVARLAADWFSRHLASPGAAASIVPVQQWPSFLEEFSRRHRGWLATVTSFPAGRAPQAVATTRPLESIQPIGEAGRTSAFEIRFADAALPPTVAILGPKIVRVDETPRGSERGVDVEDRYGLRTAVRFHHTALPEEVNGIAAAEL
jgi:putative phosphoribosyl transferase